MVSFGEGTQINIFKFVWIILLNNFFYTKINNTLKYKYDL